MPAAGLPRHLKLAPGVTVLPGPDEVTLVAGEDRRWALAAPGVEGWLPGLLEALDGAPVAELLAALDDARRTAAQALMTRLLAERALLEAFAHEVPRGPARGWAVEGRGPLRARLAALAPGASEATPDPAGVQVLVEDRLDHARTRDLAARAHAGEVPYLWVTTGPSSRALVSPLFLPGTSPCLGCLLAGSERRSPTPGLYPRLRNHVDGGGAVAPADFPAAALDLVAGLVAAKLARAEGDPLDEAVTGLHVLECADLTASLYPLPAERGCQTCGR